MIHWDDRGPQSWNGVHVTHRTTVAELIDVDNVGPQDTLLAGFDMFRNAGDCLDEVIQKAREAGKRILPIGAGWALSKINITDGWLVNTFPQTAFISSQQVLILVPALILLGAILAGLSSLLTLRRYVKV